MTPYHLCIAAAAAAAACFRSHDALPTLRRCSPSPSQIRPPSLLPPQSTLRIRLPNHSVHLRRRLHLNTAPSPSHHQGHLLFIRLSDYSLPCLLGKLQVLIPHEDLVWNMQDEETIRTTSQDSDGINRSATLAFLSCHPTLLTSSALDVLRMLATLRRLSRKPHRR